MLIHELNLEDRRRRKYAPPAHVVVEHQLRCEVWVEWCSDVNDLRRYNHLLIRVVVTENDSRGTVDVFREHTNAYITLDASNLDTFLARAHLHHGPVYVRTANTLIELGGACESASRGTGEENLAVTGSNGENLDDLVAAAYPQRATLRELIRHDR